MMNEMKYRRSTLLALLLLCLSIFVLAVPKAADAAGIGNARVIDEMNLLSDAEVQKLDAQLAAVERTHRIRILAAIAGDWKDKPLKPLAENIIKTIAPGGENGAVLLPSRPKTTPTTSPPMQSSGHASPTRALSTSRRNSCPPSRARNTPICSRHLVKSRAKCSPTTRRKASPSPRAAHSVPLHVQSRLERHRQGMRAWALCA